MIKKYTINTSISSLDSKLDLCCGDLVLLASRLDIDKTAFALNIATNVAQQKIPVAIFSLEMSNEQLTERILSSQAGFSSHDLQTDDIQVEQWDLISNAIGQIADYPIFLDNTSDITVNDMKAKIHRINHYPETKSIGLVIVDNIQLMCSDKQVQDILRELKIMARELDVPVIALSHMPDQHDFGSAGQDTDIVLFLSRDDNYEDADRTMIECTITKNSHGETDIIPLRWDSVHARFYGVDIAHGYDG